MSSSKVLIYLLRRDLRVSDNPILNHLATSRDHGFTHLLPIYVFPSHQIEVSGFLKDGEKSPYPKALSRVGKFWRCGPHRAKFIARSVWDLKSNLEELNSGLLLRTGSFADVLKHTIQGFKDGAESIGAVWMTEEMSHEEIQEQEAIAGVCSEYDIQFKLWSDEKYFVDDRDNGLSKGAEDLPDVFTTYRKSQEPLRQRPRLALSRPETTSLPPLPDNIPAAQHPFVMSTTVEDLESRLLQPLQGTVLDNAPSYPKGAESAHPFQGGETNAHERVRHLIKSGAITSYKETRNGLVGVDYSTKISAFLCLGCITARQIHEEMCHFEDGKNSDYASANGYGAGENDGTKAVRFELLWRDYMRLCTQKFGLKLFRQAGFRDKKSYAKRKWVTANKKAATCDQNPSPEKVATQIQRFLEGTTGMGLIDASQRELFHTGYTSNRTRQNVASFFSKHLGIDWRYGAEWYEMLLVDFDVSSNWANWQYVAGVGNDPRGDARIFNPVKQAFDYDKEAVYVRTWVPEVKHLARPENVFQVCTASRTELEQCGLKDNIMVTDPMKRIEFTVIPKPKSSRRAFPRRKNFPRGGRGGGGPPTGGGHGDRNGSWSSGSGNGSNGNVNGNANANGGGGMNRSWVGGSAFGGTRSSNEGASDSVNGRQNLKLAAQRGWSNDFQAYGGSTAYSRNPVPNTYFGNWNTGYDLYSDAGYTNGYGNPVAYSNNPWQVAWDQPNRVVYSDYQGGQSWGAWDGYSGQTQYGPAPTYLQMPPYIGPAV